MNTKLDLDVVAEWPNVRKVREQVGALLGSFDASVRIATMMTASELVENAIKYGEAVPSAPLVSFSLSASPGAVSIRVVNGSLNTQGVRELERRVDEVSHADDTHVLYMRRLKELCLSPGESGRLGIYRVACEGEFRLRFDYSDGVVTVVATREFDV
jgi:anti-sigma regulatory factor (Ser/Thr protein kinase)